MVSTSPENTLLVIGDPKGSISRYVPDRADIAVAANIAEAKELLAGGRFAAAALVMSSFGDKEIKEAIAEIHRQNSSTALYLLARMHEEPVARRLMDACRNGAGGYVRDYFICPCETGKMLGADESRLIGAASVVAGRSWERLGGDYSRDELIEQLVQMATEDPLTKLKNRRYADEFLDQAIERARQTSTTVTLVLLDIDDFKHYNDTYGHKVGDSVLSQAAVFIKRCCRGHDVVARIGGDEFAVILWDIPPGAQGQADSDAARRDDRRSRGVLHPDESHVIERFRKQLIGNPLPLLGPAGVGVLTVSGGLASFPKDGSSAEELFAAADAALLQAKRSGKNRIYLVGQGGD